MANALRNDLAEFVENGSAKRIHTDLSGNVVERNRDYAKEEAGRSTGEMKVRTRQDIIDRATRDAKAYGMDRSEYISHLITGQPLPASEAAPLSESFYLTAYARKINKGIDEARKKLAEGTDTHLVIGELQAVRRAIAGRMLNLRTAYVDALNATKKTQDSWDDNEAK